jgi:hypothetical protein
MIGKWNNEFRKVNLIKEIKLGLWLKASFYDIFIYILNQFFHHYFFILSGTVFVPQHLKTAQAVLVEIG